LSHIVWVYGVCVSIVQFVGIPLAPLGQVTPSAWMNVPVEETIKPQLTEEDQRSQKARRVLKTGITLLGIASALLFAYVVYTLYLLLY